MHYGKKAHDDDLQQVVSRALEAGVIGLGVPDRRRVGVGRELGRLRRLVLVALGVVVVRGVAGQVDRAQVAAPDALGVAGTALGARRQEADRRGGL